jgi:hypothetical protein
MRHVEAVAHDRDAAARHGLRPRRPRGVTPKPLGLEAVKSAGVVTWSNSGVSDVVHPRLLVGAGGTGKPPYWPDGMMLSAVPAKSSAEAAAGGEKECAAAASAARVTRDMARAT